MARCKHPVYLVEEFNALGVVLTCLRCEITLQMDQDVIEEGYVYFTHPLPGREEKDLLIYLRADLLDKWPKYL